MGEKGLGRGLDSLLGGDSYEDFQVNLNDSSVVVDSGINSVQEVSIDFVSPNIDQPRKDFDENALIELSESIKEKGIIQPILVEKHGYNKYVIIAGERRYRASKRAGLEIIPVIVREFADDQDRLEVALIENIQRENLSAIEEALAYKSLMEMGSLSQEVVAKKVGKKRSTVANALRLLKLPDDMQKAVSDGELSAGHARAILSLINPADQRVLYNKILSNQLSVRDAEKVSQDLNNGVRSFSGDETKEKDLKKAKEASPELLQLQQTFIDIFGTKVSIKGSLKAGKIEVSYYSKEDLERIYDILVPSSSKESE
ncbi:MAG: ParB/RepB/Spo0J family partition protein [Spirochaetales bacterium]|nr:ParB/RepB/Spo0J family partition protein [Spirochaetales bacterium]